MGRKRDAQGSSPGGHHRMVGRKGADDEEEGEFGSATLGSRRSVTG